MAVGIQRIDTGRTHGWQARVSIRGKRETKFFADKKYGGSEKAKNLAIEWREEMLSDYDYKPPGKALALGPGRGQERHNHLGIPGVHLYKPEGRGWQVIATWPRESYEMERRQFSARKYGFLKALLMACRARFEGVGDQLEEESAVELYRRAIRDATPWLKRILREEEES